MQRMLMSKNDEEVRDRRHSMALMAAHAQELGNRREESEAAQPKSAYLQPMASAVVLVFVLEWQRSSPIRSRIL